jgi:hypothetical protein
VFIEPAIFGASFQALVGGLGVSPGEEPSSLDRAWYFVAGGPLEGDDGFTKILTTKRHREFVQQSNLVVVAEIREALKGELS